MLLNQQFSNGEIIFLNGFGPDEKVLMINFFDLPWLSLIDQAKPVHEFETPNCLLCDCLVIKISFDSTAFSYIYFWQWKLC